MEVCKKTDKPKLTSSPFVSYFQYRANYEQYWNYNTKALQFEDVVETIWAILAILTITSFILITAVVMIKHTLMPTMQMK